LAAVTLLGSATVNTSSGTKTVTATPTAGRLIVIVTAHTGNTSAAAPTDDQSGTYSIIAGPFVKASSADTIYIWARDSLTPSAISTVFTHAPGASSGGGLAVLEVSGMTRAGVSAKRQAAGQDNQASGGTPAPVFGSAVLTGNPVIGAVFNATNTAGNSGITQRASFTERVDTGYITPTTGIEVMSIDSGETGTTMTWGSTSGSAFCSIIVELDTSAVATLSPPPFNPMAIYLPFLVR
jgi:hypothetical protein